MQPDTPSIREHNKKKQKRQYYWWLYHIRKALRARQNGYCPDCHQEKKTRLYRLKKRDDLPGINDYLLLCSDCIAKKRADKEKQRREERRKRQEEELKARVWQRGPGKRGGSPESSKLNFLNSIRSQIFERDGHRCIFCQTEKDLGLSPLIPECRGGQVTYSNYVCCCQRDRASKGRQFPLEFILKREFYPYCTTSDPEDEITVHQSAAGTRISLYLVAEVSRFLHRLAADKNGEISQFLSRIMANNALDMELKIEAERLRSKLNELDRKLRSKAERLQVKLNETPEDKAKRRKAERSSMNSWMN